MEAPESSLTNSIRATMRMNVERYRLKRMAALVKGQRILDIGYSANPNPYFPIDMQVVGVDRTQGEDKPQNYCEIYTEDVYDFLSKTPKFDTIVAGEVIEHLTDPMRFLQSCFNVLTSEGRLVISTPNPYQPFEFLSNVLKSERFFYNADHVMIFVPRWIKRMLVLIGFSEIKYYSGGLHLPGSQISFPVPYILATQVIYVADK